jgi:transcriptional regulator with XRE-family HTH domain
VPDPDEEDEMRPQGPTISKWQLGDQLQKMREAKGLSPQDIADLLGCSESKIYKLEKGENNINLSELKALLDEFAVSGEHRETMLELQRRGKERGWWVKYGTLPAPYSMYIGLESAATTLRMFEQTVVPGLFQTEDYARATIWHHKPEDVQRRVKVRMARKERIFDDEEPLSVRAVIDEAAIRRKVGGNEVMRAQLEHLLELMERPNVRLQVLPFDIGAYPEPLGAFTILEFPDDVHTPVVYTEGLAGDAYMEKSDEVRRCSLNFEDMQSSALSLPESKWLIAEQLKALA